MLQNKQMAASRMLDAIDECAVWAAIDIHALG